jgi:hypothetical protein
MFKFDEFWPESHSHPPNDMFTSTLVESNSGTYKSPSFLQCFHPYHHITVTILDVIDDPVFYLKPDVSETGFCLCIQVEPTQLGQIDIAEKFLPEDWDKIQSPKSRI